jgi:hypothetical protein
MSINLRLDAYHLASTDDAELLDFGIGTDSGTELALGD